MELLVPLILAALPVVPGPSGIDLERIVDSRAELPGAAGPIRFDAGDTGIPCGESVLFRAFEDTLDPRFGSYLVSPAGIELVVDDDTGVPGSAGIFSSAIDMSCVAGAILFRGSETPSPGQRWAIYRWQPGGIIALVQAADVPTGPGLIQSFLELSADAHGIAVVGGLAFPDTGEVVAIKPYAEPLVVVADTTMTLPNQSAPADTFSLPIAAGRGVFFKARTFLNPGLYYWSSETGITVVADHETPVPPGGGTFSSFGSTALLSEGLAFEGTSGIGRGIYVHRGGAIEPLVVPGDVTEAGETITAAYFASGSGTTLAFIGLTAENPVSPAAFARTPDGALHRILGDGDTVEGQTVSLINARARGPHVVVWVWTFPGGELVDVLYRATFAAPTDIPLLSPAGSLLLLLLLAVAGLLVLRPRHG